jgi:hypothetical protein
VCVAKHYVLACSAVLCAYAGIGASWAKACEFFAVTGSAGHVDVMAGKHCKCELCALLLGHREAHMFCSESILDCDHVITLSDTCSWHCHLCNCCTHSSTAAHPAAAGAAGGPQALPGTAAIDIDNISLVDISTCSRQLDSRAGRYGSCEATHHCCCF